MKNFTGIVNDLLGNNPTVNVSKTTLQNMGINADDFCIDIEKMNKDTSSEFVFEPRDPSPRDQEDFTIIISRREIS